MYSLDGHLFSLFLRNLVWEHFIITCLFSGLFIFSDKTQDPIYDLGPLPLHIYINNDKHEFVVQLEILI